MATEERSVIAYLRVSTAKQRASHLGIEAQEAAIAEFCRSNGCKVTEEFREVESGKRNDRPILRKALARAKATKSALLIAKLDRLARNVAFIANLMEAGVEFRACDMPEASRFILHVMSAVAEQEARAISDRTKAALAAYKARGGRLGAANPACRRFSRELAIKGAQRTASLAKAANAEPMAIAIRLRADGLSLAAIARELSRRGIFSRSGRSWSPMQVSRLLKRAA